MFGHTIGPTLASTISTASSRGRPSLLREARAYRSFDSRLRFLWRTPSSSPSSSSSSSSFSPHPRCCYRIEKGVRACSSVESSYSSTHSQTSQNDPLFVSQHFERLPDDAILEYLQRKGLVTKVTDTHIMAQTCPFCKPHKNQRSNMWKLYILRGGGAFICHRCGSKGSWYEFKQRLGDIRHAMDVSGQLVGESQPLIPVPDQAIVKKFPDGLVKKPEVSDYLTKERGLSMETLVEFQVGAAAYSFAEGNIWQENTCITFPWFNESGDVVRVKVRSLTTKSNMRLDPKGGGWGFFGLNTVSKDCQEIVVTEGEFDAMSVYQATGRPTISLPNGASSLPLQTLKMLERFERIILWMDDDVAGHQGAQWIANKLGARRCVVVSTRDGKADGPKDANDALKEGLDLESIISKAKPISHQEVTVFSQFRDEIYREFANPSQVRGIPSLDLPSLSDILKGHRPGELTIVTGPTGCGKTTIISQLSLDFCRQGVTTLWGSFEIKNVTLAKKMLTQFAAMDLEKYLHKFDSVASKFENLPLYFLKFFGSTEVDRVLDAMDYVVYAHDVRHVILDNLQFMTSGQGRSSFDKFDIQDRAIQKFRKFATERDVHVTLVMHPRKSDDHVALGLNSVFGSAKATQEADNIIICQVGKYYRYLDIRKNRFDGTLGRIPYRFEKGTQKIYELTEEEKAEMESGDARHS